MFEHQIKIFIPHYILTTGVGLISVTLLNLGFRKILNVCSKCKVLNVWRSVLNILCDNNFDNYVILNIKEILPNVCFWILFKSLTYTQWHSKIPGLQYLCNWYSHLFGVPTFLSLIHCWVCFHHLSTIDIYIN